MSQVGFISRLLGSGSGAPTSQSSAHSSQKNSKSTFTSDINSSSIPTTISNIGGASSNSKRSSFKYETHFLGFTLLCVISLCITGARCDSSDDAGADIQMKMRSFLSSHCNKQNQTLEQEEYETFIRCNPTQAAMIIRNVDRHKEVDEAVRHKEIQKEINSQCSAWPAKRSCQKKNFKLIEKCFDGQQKFVFYFLLALTDTICQDGDSFIEFWEKGGSKCLNEHLMKLTQEISECFTFTSTMTKEELDRNIDKITSCIGDKFANCGNPESNQLIQNLLRDLESFYNEIKYSSVTSKSSQMSTNIFTLISLSFLTLFRQQVGSNLFR